MRILLLLVLVIRVVGAISNASIYTAFSSVFNLRDEIRDSETPVLRQALLELEKMGVNASLSNVCSLSEDTTSLLLMKAALAEYVLGLRDPNDWAVVVADAETRQLVRQRSFSATRFAVIESLLITSVVALGRVLWLQKT